MNGIANVSVVIIHAEDVVRRCGYCDHFVTMCVYGYVGVYVSTIKRKPLIGIVVVIDSLSKPTYFWFKMARIRDTGSSFRTFWHPFICVERMQLHSSNFVHLKCITDGYCLRIKNKKRSLC